MIRVLLCLSLLCCFYSCQETANSSSTDSIENPNDDRPNVVLIVADDHGKDALGCYGNPVIQTPHLDRLAKMSTRFNRAFCTTASCSASRSVILSGLHNHRNGQYGHMHSYHHFISFDDFKSLPVLLEESGYRTARIGKYHVAPEKVYHFQEAFQASARSPVEMADKCADFLKAEGAPFFLYFCFSDPHRGGGFAEELPHQPNRFGNRPKSYPGITEITYDPNKVLVPDFLSDTPETRAEIAQYYQSVSRLDQGVGKLLDYLEEAGKLNNTMIIYISDNGMAFPGAKTTLYEAGMQLPCLVKLPNQTQEHVSETLISWTDLAPTILDVTGNLDTDSLFHGVSFRPVLEGKSLDRNVVFASHTFHEITMYYPMRVVRGERYKLIMNIAHGLDYPFASDLYASKTWQSILSNKLNTLGKKPISEFLNRPEFELYDLEKDPNETLNLAYQNDYQEILSGPAEAIEKLSGRDARSLEIEMETRMITKIGCISMQQQLYFLTLCLFIFSCKASQKVSINPNTPGKWEDVISSDGSLPVQRHEAAYVRVGDKFYLIGGRGMKPVDIFDPETKTWTQAPSAPIEMHHCQTCSLQKTKSM